MALTYPVLHQSVEQHQGTFSREDFNLLSGLVRAANYETHQTDMVLRATLLEDLDRYVEPDITRRRLFIGRVAFNRLEDEEMAGFATTFENPETEGEHIDRLFVHRTSRGRKLGQQLIEKCVEVAVANNSSYIQYDPAYDKPFTEAEKRVFTSLDFSLSKDGKPYLKL